MSNTTRNESDHLPKEKKGPPLGKWFLLKLLGLGNFPVGKDRNKDLLLTTVSNPKAYSQLTGSEQNADPDSYRDTSTSPGFGINSEAVLSKEC